VPSTTLCLFGLKVVDLTQVIAGPYAAMQLAALGAHVVKVEAPQGDPMRWRGGSDAAAAKQGLSTHFQAHARGRRVVHLDWTEAHGIDVLNAELRDADVFICNLRSHVLPRQGLGDTALRERFPRLIVCKLSGYNDDSDECAAWPAYDNTIQAASGLMRLSSASDTGARVGAPILDYAAGMASVSAILAALFERERSGNGQIVKVNMLAVAHQLTTAQRFDMQQTGVSPTYKGNQANSGEPLSMVFDTGDGSLALAVNEEHQFAKLAQALGVESLSIDPHFSTRELRRQHARELQAMVQSALRTRSAHEWERVLNRAGVAAAAVRTLSESIKHPGAEANPALFRMERGAVDTSALKAAERYVAASAAENVSDNVDENLAREHRVA
jgi:CoA:oxalate CoA-transferase